MFARVEVTVRPDLLGPTTDEFLRKIKLDDPELRKRIRWSWMLDVYWIYLPEATREELIFAFGEICLDRAFQWVFTGNLMPSAAGKTGGLQDLMEFAPNRPGKFWGIERRFRAGVTDPVGHTLIEAFEMVLGRKLPDARAASGGLLLLEGPDLSEDVLSCIARDIFCNETAETWTLVPEEGLKHNDRFHQERLRYDLPRITPRMTDQAEFFPLKDLGERKFKTAAENLVSTFNSDEITKIQTYFDSLGKSMATDVEISLLSKLSLLKRQSPREIFHQTVSEISKDLNAPWILSRDSDLENSGIFQWDHESALCFRLDSHSPQNGVHPFGVAVSGVTQSIRKILECGRGARPILNTQVIGLADFEPPYSSRRILDELRRGCEQVSNKMGVPMLNGALVFDDRYLEQSVLFTGAAGVIPLGMVAAEPVESGDQVCLVGGRVGREVSGGGVEKSQYAPSFPVQMEDPLLQKKLNDFLLEARDLGLYRAVGSRRAGGREGVVVSVLALAQNSAGVSIDLDRVQLKFAGLRAAEIAGGDIQDVWTLAVPGEKLEPFRELARRRGLEVSHLGEFLGNGRQLEIYFESKKVLQLGLDFLGDFLRADLSPDLARDRVPDLAPDLAMDQAMDLAAHSGSGTWPEFDRPALHRAFKILPDILEEETGSDPQTYYVETLFGLLERPNLTSREYLIRQFDHEVQGMSVIKPLHTVAAGTTEAYSGPNDGAVVQPDPSSECGVAVGTGIHLKFLNQDPALLAQATVDEAIRNVLCVGAEFGRAESVMALALSLNLPTNQAPLNGWLAQLCTGLKTACLGLRVPVLTATQSRRGSVPTLVASAFAKVPRVMEAKSADFKMAGDQIFLLGSADLGLKGSEMDLLWQSKGGPVYEYLNTVADLNKVGLPSWLTAIQIYSWLGRAVGKGQNKLKSIHDVSEGGLAAAVAESLLARGLGVRLELPVAQNPWEFLFGEGFHHFVVSTGAGDVSLLEAEWKEHGVPYFYLGEVENSERLEVHHQDFLFSATVSKLRAAWSKEGFWE